MKTIKVIDLLNKIANDEELPEIIKVMGVTYYLCEGDLSGCCYFSEEQGFGGFKLSFDTSVMNYEVEIIEDTPKEDKKIEVIDISKFPKKNNSLKKTALKVNEIIKLLNNSVLLSEKEVGKFLDKVNGE